MLAVDVPAEVREHEVEINLGDRRYRVRGMARNMSFEQLRINLLVAQGECFHVDNLDLYSARQRGVYVRQAATELGVKPDVVKREVGKVLLKLEQLQEVLASHSLAPVGLAEGAAELVLEQAVDPAQHVDAAGVVEHGDGPEGLGGDGAAGRLRTIVTR